MESNLYSPLITRGNHEDYTGFENSDDYQSKQPIILDRTRNTEEHSFWFFNLFYCFYFPYICRCSSIYDRDVPIVSKEDRCAAQSQKLARTYKPVFESYARFELPDNFLLSTFLLETKRPFLPFMRYCLKLS